MLDLNSSIQPNLNKILKVPCVELKIIKLLVLTSFYKQTKKMVQTPFSKIQMKVCIIVDSLDFCEECGVQLCHVIKSNSSKLILCTVYIIYYYSIISIKRTVLLTVLFGKSEKISIKRTVHLKKSLKNEIVYCFY